MMKIYFEKTNGNNNVIITNGETAKIFDAAPSGIYEGIDLYSDDAAEQLTRYFNGLEESGELNEYSDMYSANEVDYDDIAEELEETELVFENDDEEDEKVVTLSYRHGIKGEEIENGEEYYLGQLWDGDGDGEEILESGYVSPDGEKIVKFEIVEEDDDILETLVKVTDIY